MRRSRRVVPAGLLPLLPVGMVVASDAAVSTCTEAGFDAALATAQHNDGGTITFTSEKTITAPNTVIIDGGEELITLDGGDILRLFSVDNGATLVLENLTVSGGNAASFGGALDN